MYALKLEQELWKEYTTGILQLKVQVGGYAVATGIWKTKKSVTVKPSKSS